jgi:hypothetical protein
MICPRCKIPMNHHAEKLREPRDAPEAARMDARMGGVLEEFHSCPNCGMTSSRASL